MPELLSKIPPGMRYHSGREARLRRAIEDRVMSIFNEHNYEEIVTPGLDYYALFERGMGAEAASRAFRFADADGSLLALRPDVTSTLARAAATLFATRTRPLRLCYAANVWRANARSGAEWRREGKHLGCELIGARDESVTRTGSDIEMLSIVAAIIARLDLQDTCRITINNVGIFNGIAARLNLDTEGRERVRRLIDARDSSGVQNFLTAHTDDTQDCAEFGRLVRMTGRDEMFAAGRRIITNEQSVRALDELEAVWRGIASHELNRCFEIDFGDTSELDYYTGTVIKIYIAGAGTRAGNGGRYDDLIKLFGQSETAIGFMFDLDALTDALRKESGVGSQESE